MIKCARNIRGICVLMLQVDWEGGNYCVLCGTAVERLRDALAEYNENSPGVR